MALELDQRFGPFKRNRYELEEARIRVSIGTIQVKRVYFVDVEKILEAAANVSASTTSPCETSSMTMRMWIRTRSATVSGNSSACSHLKGYST